MVETDIQDQERREKKTWKRDKRSKYISSEVSDHTTTSPGHTMRTETRNLQSVRTNKTWIQLYNHVIQPSFLIKKHTDDLCHAFQTIPPAHPELSRLVSPAAGM